MDTTENKRSKKISFCITCRNRLWQLQQTLRENLSCLDDDMEICIVDYGSSDGLSEWIWDNFSNRIESGQIIFFEVKNQVSWSSPKAKNLAHRISTGDYLFNLDADNFICSADIDCIRQAIRLDVPCWQYSKNLPDGSYGRIGMPRELFFKLGGYDEGLLPMGGQDYDLMHRITALNIQVMKLPSARIDAIHNAIEQKVSEVNLVENNPEITYNRMNNFNVRKSKLRLDLEGAIITGGFSSFKGLLNGKPTLIDGFNNFYF